MAKLPTHVAAFGIQEGLYFSSDRPEMLVAGDHAGKLRHTRSHVNEPGDEFAEFVVTLPAGPAELRTAFHGEDGTERGAYYVYVERL
jgi:hypothetical protein